MPCLTEDFLTGIYEDGDKSASPTLLRPPCIIPLFPVMIHFNFHGPSLTVSSGGHTVWNVFQAAQTILDKNEADYVLIGMGDSRCRMLNQALAEAGKAGLASYGPLSRSSWLGEGWISMVLGNVDSDRTHSSIRIEGENLSFKDIPEEFLFSWGNEHKLA